MHGDLQGWRIAGRQRSNRGTIYLAYQPSHILQTDIERQL